MLKEEKIKLVVAGALSVAGFLFGGFDKMLMALAAMIILDFISGTIKAVVNKELSSKVMFTGGIKKVGVFFIVAIANITDNALNLSGGLRACAIGYYIANEGLSIMENWGSMGLPLPSKLREILKKFSDDTSGEKVDLK